MTEQTHRWGNPSPRYKRGYDANHDRIRRALLREEPNCRTCSDEGRVTKATHADHIIPRCQGGPTERRNYQPLCTAHSRSKSGLEGAMMRAARKRARMALTDRDREAGADD